MEVREMGRKVVVSLGFGKERTLASFQIEGTYECWYTVLKRRRRQEWSSGEP
jgi:hypothetical protein